MLEYALTLIFLAIAMIFFVRTNLLLFLVAIEMIILATNLSFVYHSIQLDDFFGFNFVIVLLILAAAETAVGLAIAVVYFLQQGNSKGDDISGLKG